MITDVGDETAAAIEALPISERAAAYIEALEVLRRSLDETDTALDLGAANNADTGA